MTRMPPLEQLLEASSTHLMTRAGLIEAVVLALALAVGWLVGRYLRRRFEGAERWKFGKGGFTRVAFPLVALVIVWIAMRALERSQPVPLLSFAAVLILAFTGIRFLVYMLRTVLPQGGTLVVSERATVVTIWLGVVLHMLGILPEIWESLEALKFPIGKQQVSFLQVLQAVVTAAITLTVALWISHLAEGRLLAHERMDLSLRVVLAKFTRAIALFIGILVALPIVGIDITALSVFGGALGVGLGLGMQKIASNYVSGFIILLDRSIRIGDLITADSRYGIVKGIYARYTVVQSLDGTEAIIPNDVLLNNTVTNHSYSDRLTSIKVLVTVGYGTNLDEAFSVLTAAAKGQPRILAEPPPGAVVTDLGDSGINLELGAWVADADKGVSQLRSDLFRAILSGLESRGIEIPFPKRDVRLETVQVGK
jgi:small-conductance mechanosensitive channel